MQSPEDFAQLTGAPLPSLPPSFVVRAAVALRRLVLRCLDGVFPADVVVMEASMGFWLTHALGAVSRLGVADLLCEEPMSAETLAARLGSHPDSTARLMQGLTSAGFFRRATGGKYANNRLSLPLRRGTLTQTKSWVEYLASRSLQSSWLELETTLATGANGFEHVFGMTTWEWFEQHAPEQHTFALAMQGLTVRDAAVISGLYPFSEINSLCDVGGGQGTLLSELLIRHPHLKGVLVDSPGTLVSARILLERREVLARVVLTPGSFFERVPEGADAYLLKNILHDWDDARCLKILSTCRAAMRPGTRILLSEMLLNPERPDRYTAFSDLQMMVVCAGGRERTASELGELLEAAGFAVGRLYRAATLGILEGVAR